MGIVICKRAAMVYVAGHATNALVLLQNSKKLVLFTQKKT
jgi:hypothetical protein